jgi:hypothetical protein
MTIQETIVQEMRDKNTDAFTKSILKVLVAEFQRGPFKEISDEDATKTINKCIKNERILIAHARTISDESNSIKTIDILSKYIKHNTQVSLEDVQKWIVDNVDFSKLPNKMAAMKSIMQQFKGQIEGSEVKDLLSKM